MKRVWTRIFLFLLFLICLGHIMSSVLSPPKATVERRFTKLYKQVEHVTVETEMAANSSFPTVNENEENVSAPSSNRKALLWRRTETDPFETERLPVQRIGNVKELPVMTVGIPTVLRRNKSYLVETMKSMVTSLQAVHRENCAFVIYVAEPDSDIFLQVAKSIQESFQKEIDSRLIEVISPPRQLYPKWEDKVRTNFGDSFERSKWRSKQNLDAQFLISYVTKYIAPEYFLLMEDDVLASNNYMSEILQEVQSARAPKDWHYFSFSKVGGAGKVFNPESLRQFDSYLRIYWNYKPLDWILWDFTRAKVCGYEDSDKSCREKWNKVAVSYRKSLFKHLGKVSSKTNNLFTHPISPG